MVVYWLAKQESKINNIKFLGIGTRIKKLFPPNFDESVSRLDICRQRLSPKPNSSGFIKKGVKMEQRHLGATFFLKVGGI